MHQGESAENRHRDGDARDDGRPEAAQEEKDDHHDERDRDQHRELHVIDRSADGLRAVLHDIDIHRMRDGRLKTRHVRFDAIDRVDDVGARLLEHEKLNAWRAIGPGADMGVLRRIDRDADILDANRRAMAIGDDDVIPGRGLENLIVGIDGEALMRPVEHALGRIDRRIGDYHAHVLKAEAEVSELRRIDLDTDGRLLLADDEHLADAGELAQLLGDDVLSIIIDNRIGSVSDFAASISTGASDGLILR